MRIQRDPAGIKDTRRMDKSKLCVNKWSYTKGGATASDCPAFDKLNRAGLILVLTIMFIFTAKTMAQGAEKKVDGPKEKVEILRDTYGIPHIYAESEIGVFYGLGWADAEDSAHIIYREAVSAQGRLAEFFLPGPNETVFSLLNNDIVARAFGYFDIAASWNLLPKETIDVLCAYLKGFNDYIKSINKSGKLKNRYNIPGGREYSDVIAKYGELSMRELVAMLIRKNNMEAFITLNSRERGLYDTTLQAFSEGGSNALAISGDLTDYGAPMLYGDPHTLWEGTQRLAHVSAPGLSMFTNYYGPLPMDGIVNSLAIAHTRNSPDSIDLFYEKISPESADNYIYNGQSLRIEKKQVSLKVRDQDPREITLYFTKHGWLMGYNPDGEPSSSPQKPFSVKSSACDIAGDSLSSLKFISQRISQIKATSINDFYNINRRPYTSQSAFVLADKDNNISYMWSGMAPVRASDINKKANVRDTAQPLEGWLPASGWSDKVWSLGDPDFPLPYILNPPGGNVRSANDAPWYSWGCDPAQSSRPSNIPFHVVARGNETTERGLLLKKILCSREVKNLETLKTSIAFNTLCPTARDFVQSIESGWKIHGERIASEIQPEEDALKLDRILRDWNFRSDINEVGMSVMFHLKRITYLPAFDANYTPTYQEMETYLRDLSKTARTMNNLYNRLEVPWGEMHIMIRGGEGIPMPGGTSNIPSLLSAHMGYNFNILLERDSDAMYGDLPSQTKQDFIGKILTISGSSFIHAHILNGDKSKTVFITPQGQTDARIFPDSIHVTQQTKLFAQKEWIELIEDKEELKKHLCPSGKDPKHEHPQATSLNIESTCDCAKK